MKHKLKIRVHERHNESFLPKSITIGNQVWMSENLSVDDGGKGIKYNPKNGEYYYTWDAAQRIASSISGWHIPSLDEWNEACTACGVETLNYIGPTRDAKKLCNIFKPVLAGNYNQYEDARFLYVGSYAFFWINQVIAFDRTYVRGFDVNAVMRMGKYYKDCGVSVRLVKD